MFTSACCDYSGFVACTSFVLVLDVYVCVCMYENIEACMYTSTCNVYTCTAFVYVHVYMCMYVYVCMHENSLKLAFVCV